MPNAGASIPAGKDKHADFWGTNHWFAVHTKLRRETFAAANVCALGIEIFFPRLRIEHPYSSAARTMTRPLFPGYFFAHFRPATSLESVEYSRGVLGVVSSGRFPLPVDAQIIREIHERVQPDGLIRMPLQKLKPGDVVAIQEGPFAGLVGRVERELDDGKRVTILLETLLRARVQIEKRWVEAEAA
jgi:transcription antitermination factor NusG